MQRHADLNRDQFAHLLLVNGAALSGGFEYKVQPDQAWTVGAGWAKPANRPSGTDNEMVIETSYKFQLAQNFSLMPDLQLLIDPANQPYLSRLARRLRGGDGD